MISANNKSMQEAGETLFTLNEDDRIRDQCEAREDYRRTWDSVKLDMKEKETIITELESLNAEKEIVIMEKNSRITSLEAQVTELQRQLQSSMN